MISVFFLVFYILPVILLTWLIIVEARKRKVTVTIGDLLGATVVTLTPVINFIFLIISINLIISIKDAGFFSYPVFYKKDKKDK